MLFKTKHLHQKPHRQQVSLLTRHVMLTCQSFSKQSGENKHTRCKDVKQTEYIPQPLQLLPSPHSRSNFKCIKPGGEQRDLTLGRIWTTENKVKEVYYPSSHIWKNRGISEVKKKHGKLTCCAMITLTSKSPLLDFAMHFARWSMQILIPWHFQKQATYFVDVHFCLIAGLDKWHGSGEEEKLLC